VRGCKLKKNSQDYFYEKEYANDCDLKYKVSQNQRLLVELCMQLASINYDGEKKKLSPL
jgi:DNA polymerase-3 subunit gamma/tau